MLIMGKDLDKLIEKELKKILKKKNKKDKAKKKTKGKGTKGKSKSKEHVMKKVENVNQFGVGSELVRQKPIIAPVNPLQQVQQYQPQGFGVGASIDQRNIDITKGQLNETQNKLINVEKILKKERTDAQLQGDIDKRNTGRAKRHVKRKKEDDPYFMTLADQRTINTATDAFYNLKQNAEDEKNKTIAQNDIADNHIGDKKWKDRNYKTLAQQRVLSNAFNTLKGFKEDEPLMNNALVKIQSNNMNRVMKQVRQNYFKPDDNIDVATKDPELKGPDDEALPDLTPDLTPEGIPEGDSPEGNPEGIPQGEPEGIPQGEPEGEPEGIPQDEAKNETQEDTGGETEAKSHKVADAVANIESQQPRNYLTIINSLNKDNLKAEMKIQQKLVSKEDKSKFNVTNMNKKEMIDILTKHYNEN